MPSTPYRIALAVALLGAAGLAAGCGSVSTPALGPAGQTVSQTQATGSPMSCEAIDADSYHAVHVAWPSTPPSPGGAALFEPHAQNIADAYRGGANTMRADALRAPNEVVRDRVNALAADFDAYGADVAATAGLAYNDTSTDATAKITKLRQDGRKVDADARALDVACGYR